MNAGWQTSTLGEVYDVRDGTHDSPKYQTTGYPLITSKNLRPEGLSFDDVKFISEQDYKKINERSAVHQGDVLFAMIGTIGSPTLVTVEPSFAIKNVALFKIPNGQSGTFLKHYLDSEWVVSKMIEEAKGTTQKFVGLGYLRNFPISVPPLPDQQRIVGILDDAFDGIATAKATAEKNLQNARALFESHLQSIFSQRGEGWKQKTLAEIATTFGRGKSRHRPRNEKKLYGGKYPFIQTGDIRNAEHFITEYSQTYSEAGLAQSKLWPKGSICITIAANIAETGILGFDACFPDSVIGVVTNPDEADVDFVEYLLQSFKAWIQALGKGSAQANINMGTFEHERFPFPSVAEQRQIVAKLDALREETQRLASLYQRKLAALAELKKSLLHQAFTGEL
jgi:type I restriction enzyme S subunit